MRHILGTGVLTWHPEERRSDRYGTVNLMPDPESEGSILLESGSHGMRGRLIAVVREARQSHHIGDLTHGVFPSTPNVGEEVLLGEGTLFFHRTVVCHSVGVRPDDRRRQLWLDIKALYRVHDQTVDLFFEQA